MTGESTVLEHAGVPGGVTAADGGFQQVAGGGGLAARAHGGEPQGGRVAQVVRGSGVRPASVPPRLGGEIPQGGPAAAATVIMTALEAVAPGGGSCCGSARIVLVLAVPGEGFDGPAEAVTGRAPDHGAFHGPVGGAHSEPAPYLGRQPASYCALVVQVGRAVQEHHRGLR